MSYGVTLKGLTFPDFIITFNLTDTVTNVDDVIGLAVTQDTSAANSVKLATDGAEILGRILVCEDRTSQGGGIVVSVETKGGMAIPYSTAPSIGNTVVGAGSGKVKAGEGTGPVVYEVDTVNEQAIVFVK
jgi:hypothetical protein